MEKNCSWACATYRYDDYENDKVQITACMVNKTGECFPEIYGDNPQSVNSELCWPCGMEKVSPEGDDKLFMSWDTKEDLERQSVPAEELII